MRPIPLHRPRPPRSGEPGPGRAPVGAAAMLVILALALISPEPMPAQDTGWFPDRSAFAPLLADPQEPGFRGSFVLADRGGSSGWDPSGWDPYRGTNVEAEVTLGHHFGVYRFQEEDPTRGRPAVDLGFEVGVFSRFFMETAQKDLIHADFRVGFPLAVAYRGWEARLEALHYSSHLGDDFIRAVRTQPRLVDGERKLFEQVSREGVELIVAHRPVPALRLYAGGRANYHANELAEESLARFGLEFDPGGGAGKGLGAWPYVAADLQAADNATGVSGTGAAGMLLRLPGQVLRLEARGHFGPTAIGQLRGRDVDETYLGLGLRLEF